MYMYNVAYIIRNLMFQDLKRTIVRIQSSVVPGCFNTILTGGKTSTLSP